MRLKLAHDLPAERLLTVAELAREWRCSPSHIRNLIRAGDLQYVDISNGLGTRPALRVPVSAAKAFINARAVDTRVSA